MAFYTKEQLKELGFKNLGENVLISDKASIYGSQYIEIGDNVRIDDFCILSGSSKGILIGNNVHIACYSSLVGKENITLNDFSGLSSRVSIYSSTDDYSGNFLTNPTVPEEFTNVISKPVYLGKHVIIGSNSVILPGVYLADGIAVGSLSLVTKSFEEFKVIGGIPAKIIKERSKNLLDIEWALKKQ
jgi:acetyltransferase-like isoleucine patch superfamily enzyme